MFHTVFDFLAFKNGKHSAQSHSCAYCATQLPDCFVAFLQLVRSVPWPKARTLLAAVRVVCNMTAPCGFLAPPTSLLTCVLPKSSLLRCRHPVLAEQQVDGGAVRAHCDHLVRVPGHRAPIPAGQRDQLDDHHQRRRRLRHRVLEDWQSHGHLGKAAPAHSHPDVC
jgi:hypothetical protein